MRILEVSTYPPQICGLATYTRDLAGAMSELDDVDVAVLSEHGAVDGRDGEVLSIPTFHRKTDWGAAIADAAAEQGADVVHIQHAPDIFGMDARLPALCDALKKCSIASFVTLHTVYTPFTGFIERKPLVRRFHRQLARSVDGIIVHQKTRKADELMRQGVAERQICVIPHGTGRLDLPDRSESRRFFGLPEQGPVLLYFGFIHVQKNLHTILAALPFIRRKLPDVTLLVAGKIQNSTWYNKAYLSISKAMVAGLGLKDRVVFHEEYIADERVAGLYAASDLVLLPYNQGYGSASGMVHNALAAGSPPLCSMSPKFAEVAESLSPELQIPTHNPRAWARRVLALLEDRTRLESLKELVRERAHATAWPVVARQHVDFFRSILG